MTFYLLKIGIITHISYFSTTSNIYSECDTQTSGGLEIEEEVRFIPKRHKSDTNDILNKLTSLIKELIKIETSCLGETSQSKNALVQDNIHHVVALIENLLRDMSDQGFLFGLKLLQLTTERANELCNK